MGYIWVQLQAQLQTVPLNSAPASSSQPANNRQGSMTAFPMQRILCTAGVARAAPQQTLHVGDTHGCTVTFGSRLPAKHST
jgi:hypothetical protein